MKEVIAQEPSRLDQFVAAHFGLSRAQAQKHIREGFVHRNGTVTRKASKRVQRGDIVVFRKEMCPKARVSRAPRLEDLLGRKSGLVGGKPVVSLPRIAVLYEDASCLVIDKPAGVPVHPAPTMKETTVVELLRGQCSLPGLSLAHRLDRGTSGCLLVAKTAEACEALQKQFKERKVQKEYLAIVAGIPEERNATIDAPLGRSLVHRTTMTLFRTSKSRAAATTYSVLSSSADCSLLQCTIATGRTHQIRVHLRSIGHPILGDEKYGTEHSRTVSEKLGLQHPCLHAWKLSFRSPSTAKEVHVTAPIPEALLMAANKLGLTPPS